MHSTSFSALAVMSRRFCVLAAAIILFAASASGQVNPGFPSFSAYDSHPVDNVNLQNLNVSLNVDVMSKAGAIPFNYKLVGADSYVYTFDNTWYPGIQVFPLTGTVNGNFGTSVVSTYTTYVKCPDGSSIEKYENWVIRLFDGTQHPLPTTDYVLGGGDCPTSLTATTIDGSGYTVNVAGSTLAIGYTVNSIYDRSGESVSSLSVTDANGNSISSNLQAYTDTLGITALTAKPSATSPTSLTWTNVSGGSPEVTITNTAYTLESSFGCPGISEYPSTPASLPTTLGFPDGSSLAISYEQPNTHGDGANYTGRITGIGLRTGGGISYDYAPSRPGQGGGGTFPPNDGINCTYQVPNQVVRKTDDGNDTTYTLNFVNNIETDTVIDIAGNYTVYTFTGFTASGNAPFPATQALTQVQHYLGVSDLLTTDVYCYNGLSGQPSNCSTATVSLPVTEVDVYHTISGMSTSSRTQTKYDTYGNVTYLAQYDFGGTTPVRATTITYGSCTASCGTSSPTISAIGSHVNNKPGHVLTTQNGNDIAESEYAYDSHGNLRTTYTWTGSMWLSNATPNSFNSNGTPAATYDIANTSTTYGYSSGSYTQCTGCTNFPFPTSIDVGGITTSLNWNGTGGVMNSVTDANSKSMNFGYSNSYGADPFWRVDSITDPLQNEVLRYYFASGPSGPYTESYFAFGTSLDEEWNTVDSYGRPIFLQKAQSSSGTSFDTISTSYSGTNVSQSIPCSNPSLTPCTSGIFTYGTDPLGRPTGVSDQDGGYTNMIYSQNDVLTVRGPQPSGENLKQIQRQYDGLGRLVSSCAISATVSGETSCNQSTGSYSGILTTYGYTSAAGSTTVTATRGSEARSTTNDAMGRVISTTDPESGTTTYAYDSVPSYCSGQAVAHSGQLIAALYANGNYSCYQYDPLARISSITGNNSSGPLCRRFYYDHSTGVLGAIPSGVTISYPAGRMVEAETDNCTWPVTSSTMITDEWFSYDADGNVADMWELTPHSAMYYHSHATFAGNRVPLTVQLEDPALYTETYGLDGEGRLNTLMSGTVPIVSSTTYNAASQPTKIDLGSGTDQSDYVYDSNTNRMTNWTFQVGSTESETGALTWNANATLRELAIDDGFNSAGSQTCQFGTSTVMGYDDLGRLLSNNCGSVWSQTFSYDEYDNLTKSGSISWNPGYTTKNQYQTGATYDASGNLTYDTIHTYAWDQFNKLSSIDTTNCATGGECVTYDAFGNIVESSYKGTYTEIWYTQVGKTAYMLNGNSIYYAYWPTPGGGSVEVNGNNATAYYMHKDWLGSSRISSVIVNPAVVSDQAYAPYSEVYNKVNTGAAVPGQMFTGDTQDIVSGIFDTPNRELNSSQGRWLSPDPARTGWNLYAYATNPNSVIDPSGLLPGSLPCLIATPKGPHANCDYGGDGGGGGGCVSIDGGECGSGLGGLVGGGDSNTSIVANPFTGAQYGLDAGGNVTNLSSLEDLSDSSIAELGLPPADAWELGLIFNYNLGTAASGGSAGGSFSKAVLPDGPFTNLCQSGQVIFLAPATFDLSAIVAAGEAGGVNPFAANAAEGHGGTFDFQRSTNSAGDTTFYSGYTNVSNFGVGAYLYGAGFTQYGATEIPSIVAFFESSNFGDPNQALYQNAGYQAAASGGQVTCSRFPWGP